ncbi:MAG TPA: hypothetical protein VGF41_08695, partial [Myxococcaceae bacterium]
RIKELQARAINERVIEYGLRRGLLDALRLSYEPAKDGSLLVYVPRHRGHWRIQPPGVGEASAIRVIALGDDGRRDLGAATLALTWDAVTSDWFLLDAPETEEIAAEVWKCMARLAREAGWLERTAA